MIVNLTVSVDVSNGENAGHAFLTEADAERIATDAVRDLFRSAGIRKSSIVVVEKESKGMCAVRLCSVSTA